MKLRQWLRRLCYFIKIQSNGLPDPYLNDLVPKPSLRYTTLFHLFEILKLEPNFLAIFFLHIL